MLITHIRCSSTANTGDVNSDQGSLKRIILNLLAVMELNDKNVSLVICL